MIGNFVESQEESVPGTRVVSNHICSPTHCFFSLSFSCSLKIPSFFSGTVFINSLITVTSNPTEFHLWTSHVIYLNLISHQPSEEPKPVWLEGHRCPGKEQPRGGKNPSHLYSDQPRCSVLRNHLQFVLTPTSPRLSLPLSPMNRLPLIHPSFMLPHLLLPL